MQNAQNFAPVVSSMVLEPSFFDIFLTFSSLGVSGRVFLDIFLTFSSLGVFGRGYGTR